MSYYDMGSGNLDFGGDKEPHSLTVEYEWWKESRDPFPDLEYDEASRRWVPVARDLGTGIPFIPEGSHSSDLVIEYSRPKPPPKKSRSHRSIVNRPTTDLLNAPPPYSGMVSLFDERQRLEDLFGGRDDTMPFLRPRKGKGK